MIHVPRVEATHPGTASDMNPISTVKGITHHVLKTPFTLAETATRIARSVIGSQQDEPTSHEARPEPEVDISPDRPVNVTEELGLDPSPVAKAKRPRQQAEKPVTSIDAEADPTEVEVTPADVAEALSHRATQPTDE